MGGTLLVVCDPVLLQKAWENHTLTQRGSLHVEIAGRKIRVGSNPGLTQVIPADGIGSLGVPAKVTLRGTASDGSELYIRAFSLKPDHYATGEALFRHLGLAHGGTATIDVQLEGGRVAFEFRRADGSDLAPLRSSHVDGPGPQAELPRLPDQYADTPQQGVRTYVAALSGHDGKTICELWTADVRALWVHEDYPCWAAVTGLLSIGGENSGPLQRVELLEVGKTYSRKSYGVSFTAVPVTIRTHIGTSPYLTKAETREAHTTIWFRKTDDGWRIAKDPLSAGSEDASAPPDPYAAQHAKQAEQRKERKQQSLRRRSLVRLRPALSCPRVALTLEDGAYDPEAPGRRLPAGSDIVAASVAPSGRRVCFSVTFRGRPLTGSQRISLSLLSTPSDTAARRSASFRIDHDYPTADGLHAGLLDSSLGVDATRPAQARVAVKGNRLSASCALPSYFPTVRRRARAQLGLTMLVTGRLRNDAVYASDSAEAGRTPNSIAAAAAKAARAAEQNERQPRGRAGSRPLRQHACSLPRQGDKRQGQSLRT
jgi:hypothetical protein